MREFGVKGIRSLCSISRSNIEAVPGVSDYTLSRVLESSAYLLERSSPLLDNVQTVEELLSPHLVQPL